MPRRLTILIVLLGAGLAAAEPAWQEGVSADTQARAQALFEDGNGLFAKQAYAAALAKYEAAIALWDHPLIRLNKAIAALRLDRLLEAAGDLDAALRYGAEPFDEAEHRNALAHRDSIARRVGRITVSCSEPGAQVLLDGAAWFVCPGREERRVLAGTHVVVGQKDAYLPITRRLTIVGGASAVESLGFVRIDDAIAFEYPTARWIPWTIAGSGAALGAGGIALALSAARQMDRFNTAFAQRCKSGCAGDLSDVPDLRRSKERAETRHAIGVTAMIAGSATVITGVVWGVWLNRPRQKMPALDVNPTTGGVAARATWQF